jgi:hypothetical protein
LRPNRSSIVYCQSFQNSYSDSRRSSLYEGTDIFNVSAIRGHHSVILTATNVSTGFEPMLMDFERAADRN